MEGENVVQGVDSTGSLEVEEQNQENQQGADNGDEQQGERQLNQETRFDKHPRWIEREKKMQDMEERLAKYEKSQPTPSDPDFEDLKKLGFGDEQAKRVLDIIDRRNESKLSPFKQSAEKSRIDNAFKEFYNSNKEVITEEVGKEMDRLFSELTQEEQRVYSANVGSLKMLLAMAKENLGSDYNKGRQDGQISKKNKKEGGAFKGSPVGNKDSDLSDEDIDNMSDADFEKNKGRIYAKYHKIKAEQ